MRKILTITYAGYVVIMLAIIYLSIYGDLTFGNGLGDIKSLVVLVLINVALFVVWWKFIRKTLLVRNHLLFLSGLILILIITLLQLTIFRGPEFPWNGDIFL
ncbi:hypothetical protein ACX0G7_16440 [Flavitalea antarctica]